MHKNMSVLAYVSTHSYVHARTSSSCRPWPRATLGGLEPSATTSEPQPVGSSHALHLKYIRPVMCAPHASSSMYKQMCAIHHLPAICMLHMLCMRCKDKEWSERNLPQLTFGRKNYRFNKGQRKLRGMSMLRAE